ncbi:MAG: helix-turn-helix domain-containing protein [Halopseudomonas aestusnigri]|nr:helix-turn-helix domain-containing protein [Halopseudomonas aestusnigri]
MLASMVPNREPLRGIVPKRELVVKRELNRRNTQNEERPMKSSNDYLDAVQKKLGLSSDYKLAKHYGVAKSTISRYRSGRPLDNDIAWNVAEDLGIDPAEVIAVAEIERAKRSQDEEGLRVWKRRFQAVTHSAATIFGVIAIPYWDAVADKLCILCSIDHRGIERARLAF